MDTNIFKSLKKIKSYIFLCKKIKVSKLSGNSLFLLALIICPVLENIRSEGTDVAGIRVF